MPVAPPLPLPSRVPAVFLLHREQLAWIRSHAGRSASGFMRRLLAQLIEQERQEIRRLQTQLPSPSPAAASEQKRQQRLELPALPPSPSRRRRA